MIIQEAIKSGKRCRRKAKSFGPCFGKLIEYKDMIMFEYKSEITNNFSSLPLTISDILADDWEIEREPREIFLVEDKETHLKSTWFNHSENAREYYPEKHFKIVKFREVIE